MSWATFTLDQGAVPANRDFPARLADICATKFGCSGAQDSFRHFHKIGVAAAKLARAACEDDFAGTAISRFYEPPVLGPAGSNEWYVRLLAALNQAVECVERYDALVLRMSLASPESDVRRYSEQEPFNRATQMASEAGVVVVMAAGNRGMEGDDTLNFWARPDWVISVGAAGSSGRTASYSSRGRTNGPTVIALEAQTVDPESIGTSFAAPRVADIAIALASFVLRLAKAAGVSVADIKASMPRTVRLMIEDMATPTGEPKQVSGAGFVDLGDVLPYLAHLRASRVGEFLPQFDGRLTDQMIAQEFSCLKDPFQCVGSQHVAHISIDTRFEWSFPSYTPGLLRFGGARVYRVLDTLERRDELEVATTPYGQSDFIGIGIDSPVDAARQLLVDPASPQAFRTIAEAVAAAQMDDVVRIAAGTYAESVALKPRITLLGCGSVEITHPTDAPIRILNASNVALFNLSLRAQAPRTPALRIVNTVKAAVRNCRLGSEGNGIEAVGVRRLFLSHCEIDAGKNGIYSLISPEAQIYRSRIEGGSSGLLLIGSSAIVYRCSPVRAAMGDAIQFVPPVRAAGLPGSAFWLDGYPAARELVDPRDIDPRSLARIDLTGKLTRLSLGLQIIESRLEGNRGLVATTNFDHVFVSGSTSGHSSGSPWAVLQSAQPFAIEPTQSSARAAMEKAEEWLRTLGYYPVESGWEPAKTFELY
jgi:hypothetical protein